LSAISCSVKREYLFALNGKKILPYHIWPTGFSLDEDIEVDAAAGSHIAALHIGGAGYSEFAMRLYYQTKSGFIAEHGTSNGRDWDLISTSALALRPE
jgi:hypothetical protein